jgi:CBS-domain-containing membrane protein
MATYEEIILSWNTDMPPEFQFNFNKKEVDFLTKEYILEKLSDKFSIPLDQLATDIRILRNPVYHKRLAKRLTCIKYLARKGIVIAEKTTATEVARLAAREKLRDAGCSVSDDIGMKDLKVIFSRMAPNLV